VPVVEPFARMRSPSRKKRLHPFLFIHVRTGEQTCQRSRSLGVGYPT
jgi:hypothetical protein